MTTCEHEPCPEIDLLDLDAVASGQQESSTAAVELEVLPVTGTGAVVATAALGVALVASGRVLVGCAARWVQ